MTLIPGLPIRNPMETLQIIGKELNLPDSKVKAAAQLLDQGATIPFIARYRKEKTGSLDEVVLTSIRDRIEQLQALSDRKTAILKSLKDRELLTQILASDIQNASTLTVLEDLYEKYRPKKRTKAQMAKEKGLEPLSDLILKQTDCDIEKEAEKYVSVELKVGSVTDAICGAQDIIAEIINDDIDVRAGIRRLFETQATLLSKVKKGKQDEGIKFKDYFDWTEPASKSPSHRILAILRGKAEGFLGLHVLPEEDKAISQIENRYIHNQIKSTQAKSTQAGTAKIIQSAIKDSYKRLLSKSIEKELINALKIKADKKAIEIFADNLKELLLSAPLGQMRILAIDPGFRTGCKIACLDEQGSLMHHDLIQPHQNNNEKAISKINSLVKKFDIEAIAIGNGTAGRETESFIKSIGLDKRIVVVMVDESGASIYSASKVAREEFPDHDITVRGAVSIGRRLMDPLAELVKLDPKSIGVGQYQHDVDQKLLNKTLDDVVVSCVNRVGVEVNTASKELLGRVSGVNETIAANIVAYRCESGPFKTRKQLLKVPRLGPKAFEQAAGFLRIQNADNPLDNSGVHPEVYHIVNKMADDLDQNVDRLMLNSEQVNKIQISQYRTETIGLPTLKDIVKELIKPGRDPRKKFETFSFDESIHEMKDLIPGMKVPGIVTNVTAFGAFVDIGVHQDGLVHISQLADRFVKDPNEIVTVRQQVQVTILDVDIKRKRISLSMKN